MLAKKKEVSNNSFFSPNFVITKVDKYLWRRKAAVWSWHQTDNQCPGEPPGHHPLHYTRHFHYSAHCSGSVNNMSRDNQRGLKYQFTAYYKMSQKLVTFRNVLYASGEGRHYKMICFIKHTSWFLMSLFTDWWLQLIYRYVMYTYSRECYENAHGIKIQTREGIQSPGPRLLSAFMPAVRNQFSIEMGQ